MSDEVFPFSTSAEVLMVLPVGEALKESRKPECPAYGDVFLERAGAAEAAGDSILVPQLENALRHVLARARHEVTRRDKHGLQNFIQMGTMLSDRRQDLEEILRTDIVQELRVLFVDQNGADLRNQIAHGLMRHEQFFHHASIYAWWFIFHLTICPVRNRFLGTVSV